MSDHVTPLLKILTLWMIFENFNMKYNLALTVEMDSGINLIRLDSTQNNDSNNSNVGVEVGSGVPILTSNFCAAAECPIVNF